MITRTCASGVRPDASVFDRWAQVYDEERNPLLLLEERCAAPLLPSIGGSHVLDIGCGTGRWLARLEALGPASLVGVDCSSAMLDRARQKLSSMTKLIVDDCSELPGADGSYTFAMASFLLSYIKDLQNFAQECARVVRPGGWMLISDMHPATATERGWKRSFRVEGTKVDIGIYSRSLAEIQSAFQQNGFVVETLVEPSFAEPERSIFVNAGKADEFGKLVGTAAIYILKLQMRTPAISLESAKKRTTLQISNARVAVSSDAWNNETLSIEDGRVFAIGDRTSADAHTLDLSGYAVLPGLINAHDHLEFGLFPRLGRSAEASPFQNCSEWAEEIHQVHAAIIEKHRQVPKASRILWGALRNLLCGVTTVCHHNPLHENMADPDFPIRVVTDFGWSHSLAFDPHLAEKAQATSNDEPFIVHAAEGTDESSRAEIAQLDRTGVLNKHTVLVHGLACTEADIALINKRGASLIVCPTSNRFLYGKSASKQLLASVDRVALGSDSPLTAAGDLLDEVRYLHCEMGMDANSIYRMATNTAAEMLHLTGGQGQIAESGVADLIAIRSQSNTPAEVLCNATYADVELVLFAGRVQLVSQELYKRLPQAFRDGLNLFEVGSQMRWVRSNLRVLFNEAENILGLGYVMLGGREVHVADAS